MGPDRAAREPLNMEDDPTKECERHALPEDSLADCLAVFRQAQVGRCVNGVTHDINNYLGAAQAYAELVAMEASLGSESKRMLGEIVNSVQRCSRLVSSMTGVARPPERDALNMVEPTMLLEEVRTLFEYTCRARKIQLEVLKCDAPMPSILASPEKIALALIYLLWNAIEAIGPFKGEPANRAIRIGVFEEPEWISFHVWNADLEDGLDLATLVAPGTTSHPKGTGHLGLGLTAAVEVAEDHGGTLTLEPERGMVLRLTRALKN